MGASVDYSTPMRVTGRCCGFLVSARCSPRSCGPRSVRSAGSPRHASSNSWAGLTPRHRESDTTVHRGAITKQGSRLVRWAAVEAVQRTRAGTPMRARYEQVLTRRGATAKHVAKVAAARELLDCVFYALRDGRVRRLGHTGAA